MRVKKYLGSVPVVVYLVLATINLSCKTKMKLNQALIDPNLLEHPVDQPRLFNNQHRDTTKPFSRPGGPSDFYVDPTNGINDVTNISNPGILHPVQSIQFVVANSAPNVPGDNIILRQGRYCYPLEYANGSAHINFGHTNSGSPAGWVTMKSYSTPTNNEEVYLASDDQEYVMQFFSAQGTSPNASTNRLQQLADNTNFVRYIKIDGSGNDGYLANCSNRLGRHIHFWATNAPRIVMVREATNIWLTHLDFGVVQDNDHIKLVSNNPDNHGGETISGVGLTNNWYFGTNDDTAPKHCVVDFCDIHDQGDYGLKVTGWGGQDNWITNNFFHDLGGNGSDNFGCNVSGSGYGYYNKQTLNPVWPDRNAPETNVFDTDYSHRFSNSNQISCFNNHFINNVFSNIYNSCLQFTCTYSNEVRGNFFYGGGMNKQRDWGTNNAPARSGWSFGSFAWGNLGIGNTCLSNCNYGFLDDNWAVSNIIAGNVMLWNDLSNSQNANLRISGTSYWCQVYNNTLVSRGLNGPAQPAFLVRDTTNVMVSNNIIVLIGGPNDAAYITSMTTGYPFPSVMSDNNLVWNPANPTPYNMAEVGANKDINFVRTNQGVVQGPIEQHGLSVNPGLVDLTNNKPALNFWSPCINTGGSAVSLGQVGTRPDIGYLEFYPGPMYQGQIRGIWFH